MAESMLAKDGESSVGLVQRQYFTFGSDRDPFVLDSGQTIPQVTTCYETYGTLNDAGDNAILIEHGLTGSSHAAGRYKPDSKYAGYWDQLIGRGRAMDTDRYFVIAPNALGGCRGTTGPASVNPATGEPWGTTFPTVTVRDMVRAQAPLLDVLGVRRIRMAIGASMGGMQALEWAVTFPDRVIGCCPVASSAKQSALALAHNACQRHAIMMDPGWLGGSYYGTPGPERGLSLARKLGTLTYLCDPIMESRFGLAPASLDAQGPHDLDTRFRVEEHLESEGRMLVHRFDANSYLYVTRAIDLHDVGQPYGGPSAAFSRISAHVLLIGIRSDILFYPSNLRTLADGMREAGVSVQYWEMDSDYGHDAFLEEQDKLAEPIRQFLDSIDT